MTNSGEYGDYGQGEGTLTRAAEMVTTARSDFDGLARTLDGQIQGVRGKWGGAGAEAFFTLHQAWTEKQATIVSALDEFASSLTSTEKVNVSTDEDQSANYNRTAGRLGG